MLKVIMTRGLPASGKSTWAKAKVLEGGWKRINRDDLRAMIDAGQWSKENEKFIISVRNTLLQEALRAGSSVIIDDTNLPSRNFKDVCDAVYPLGLDVWVEEKFFSVDLDVAIERDSHRGTASVGATVITDMHKKFLRGGVLPQRTVNVSQNFIKALEQDNAAPKAIIVDLDGTLAIMGDRSPYDASNCHLVDEPHGPVVETVRLFWKAGYNILFVSGREAKDRDPTLTFITRALPELGLDFMLYMRPTGDNRADTIVKKEIWDTYIAGRHNVLLAIDDRPCVVRMWRYEVGLPVYQVNDKEF